MNNKIVIYQVFTRLFGNRSTKRKRGGAITENGCGKLNDFTPEVLQQIKLLGTTHIWYTGIIRHACVTDYSRYGIPRQHSSIVKGKAGSPYAITDYYDIDPDLAVDINNRVGEWEALIQRTHNEGMRVIMDFVPNHVAREYRSICKPKGVKDLGEEDEEWKHFSVNNNFYYCWEKPFSPQFPIRDGYKEIIAKATGNDCFSNSPNINDWYETVKLNYGIDYCDAGGRSEHLYPVPDTWHKMVDILLFWASKGIDGFRCDMAEMVPYQFWAYATSIVKDKYPDILFIGEVYNPNLYRTYIGSGFDYLYDKVGMYDSIKAIIRGERWASDITAQWQALDDIGDKMLYFLENHDEQRIASEYFCNDAQKAIPGLIVSALLKRNPILIYAGQEFGERGMDAEGFSGRDGRTSIFDYWSIDCIQRGYLRQGNITSDEQALYELYKKILQISVLEKSVAKGAFFDLMYANNESKGFDFSTHFAFIRKYKSEILIIIVNFSADESFVDINIPQYAFDYLGIKPGIRVSKDLLSSDKIALSLLPDTPMQVLLPRYGAKIYKVKQ